MKSVDEELIANTINEKYLSAEDKQAFSEAKNKALQVWIDNQAWRAVDRSEAQEGELVPAHASTMEAHQGRQGCKLQSHHPRLSSS